MNIRLNVRANGNWHRITHKMREAILTQVAPSRQQMREYGEDLREALLEEALFGEFVPLKPKTIAIKTAHGSPTPDTVWFDLHYTLAQGLLTPVVRVYPATGSVTTTVPLSKMAHPRTGQLYADIIMMMETGTRKMPARPIIGPTYKKIEEGSPLLRRIQKDIENRFAEHLS